MKIVVLNKADSETDTQVQGYVKEFQNRTGKNLDVVDPESPEGIDIAKLHDVLAFPAILVIENDGSFVQSWTEMDKWPTISELSFYSQ